MTFIFWVVMLTYLWAYCYAMWPKVQIWREARAFRKELDTNFPVEEVED